MATKYDFENRSRILWCGLIVAAGVAVITLINRDWPTAFGLMFCAAILFRAAKQGAHK